MWIGVFVDILVVVPQLQGGQHRCHTNSYFAASWHMETKYAQDVEMCVREHDSADAIKDKMRIKKKDKYTQKYTKSTVKYSSL